MDRENEVLRTFQVQRAQVPHAANKRLRVDAMRSLRHPSTAARPPRRTMRHNRTGNWTFF